MRLIQKVVVGLLIAMIPLFASAQTEPPQFVTVDGRLYDSTNPTNPLLDGNVAMRIQVLNPAKTCILYEEQQSVSTLANGYFNARVGSPTSGMDSLKRTGLDSGNPMSLVFQNQNAPITGLTSGGLGCSYTPSPGESRFFRFIVTPSTTGVTSTLSPDMTIDSVPQSLVAETLQGFASDDFLQINANVTQAKANTLFGGSYAALTSLIAGTSSLYLQNTTNGTVIPSSPANPGTLTPGQIWYDSTTNELKYYNGGSVQTVGTGTGLDATKLPLAGGTMTGAIDMGSNNILNAGSITQSAQRSLRFGGYDAGQQATYLGLLAPGHQGTTWYNVDTDRLMYWDGVGVQEVLTVSSANSLVPDCNADESLQMSPGPLYVWSCVPTTDSTKLALAGGAMTGALTMNAQNQVRYADADSSNFAAIQSPAVIGANYVLTLPVDDGTPGQVLQTDGNGLLSWLTIPSAPVTTVFGRSGAVVAQASDYDANQIDNTPAGGIAATDVQAALNELDSEKAVNTRNINTNANSGLAGGGNLSADRNLSVDITGTTALGTAADNADEVLIYDASGAALRKVTRAQLNLSEGEVDAFVANNGFAADADKVNRAGDTMTGALNIDNEQELRLSEADGSGANYVALKSPPAIGSNYTLTFPIDDGNSGQYLQTDGNGVLSWVTPAGVGETNTASNVTGSTGVGIFKQKSTFDLQFKSLLPGSTKLSITGGADDVTLDVVETNIDHDALVNFVANEHIDHSAVNIATAANSGLAGGGDITATRNLAVDITGTAALGAAADNADEILIYDASGTALRKVTRSQLNLSETEVDAMVANNGFLSAEADTLATVTGRGASTATNVTMDTQAQIRFADSAGGEHAAIQAPSTLPANYVLTLPADDGGSGQFLQTDGNGLLAWATPSFTITDDSLNFDKLSDSLVLDDSTDISVTGAQVLSITNAGSGNSLLVNDSGPGDTSPFVIDAGGNVGIGTTAPTSALHVVGGAKLFGGIFEFYDSGSSYELNTYNSQEIVLNSRRMLDGSTSLGGNIRLNPNVGGTNFVSRVGVGVPLGTNIDAKFHVRTQGTAGIPDALLVEANGNGGAGRGVGLLFKQPNAVSSSIDAARIAGVDAGLTFQTGAAGVLSERVRINSSGQVGIGTTIPGTQLDVAGAITARPRGTLTGETGQIILRELAASGTETASIRAPDALGASYVLTLPIDDGTPGQVLQTDGSGLLSWASGGSLVADDSLNFDKFSDTLALDASTDIAVDNAEVFSITNTGTANSFVVNDQTADASPFVIDTSGNVGIGTSAPLAQLQLQRAAYTSNSLLVQNGVTAAPPAYPGSFTPSLVVQSSQTNGSRPLFFGYDNAGSWASFMNVGACGSFNSMCLNLGQGATNYTALKNNGANLMFAGGSGSDGNFADVIFGNTGNVVIGETTSPTSKLRVSSNGAVNNKVLEVNGGGTAGGQVGPFYGVFVDANANNSSTERYGVYALGTGGGSGPNYGVYGVTGMGSSTRLAVGVQGHVDVNSAATNNSPTMSTLVAGVYATAATVGTSMNSTTTALVARNQSQYGLASYGAFIDAVPGPTTVIPLSVNYNNTEIMRVSSSGAVGIGTTLPSSLLDVAGVITSRPFGVATGNTGQLSLRELAAQGTNTATIRAPDALAANYVLTLPLDDGANGQVLSTDGNGALSWIAPGSVAANTLNFTELTDNLVLDSSTDISVTGSNIFSVTNTGTGNSFVVNDESTDTSPFIINASGNVGIGTTSASAKLDVNGRIAITKPYYEHGIEINLDGTVSTGKAPIGIIQSASSIGMNNIYLSRGTATGSAGVAFATTGVALSGATPGWVSGLANSNYAFDISEFTSGLLTDGNAHTSVSRFTILPGGNVGIGTTNPVSGRLHVAGTGFFGNGDGDGSGVRLTEISDDGVISIIDSFGAEDVRIVSHGGAGAPSWFNGGNVGIGTTNPTFLLDVAGSARIDGLQIRYGSLGLANSFAIGGSMSGGTANTVIGIAASTSTHANVVIGESATASGGSAVAIGRQSSVNTGGGATGSIAVGHGASATGDGAIAIGMGAIAPSSRILAFGHTSDPNLSIRESYFGSSVNSTSPQDHILNASGGSGTDIPGANLTLAGGKGTGAAPGGYIAFSTSASGASGTALRPLTERMRVTTAGNVGIGTTAPAYLLDVNGTVNIPGGSLYRLGHQYHYITRSGTTNEFHTSGFHTFSGTSGSIFRLAASSLEAEFYGAASIGAGYVTATAPTNGLIVQGNVGIGTTTPALKFDVVDSQAASTVARFENTSTAAGSSGIEIEIGPVSDPASTNDFIQFKDGDGTVIGQIEGTGGASVAYTTTSDRRLKENIRDTRYGLDEILKIQVRDYNYIKSSKDMTGFIAQELYEIYPNAVSRPMDEEKESWGVDYGHMTPLLVKGLQEIYGICKMDQEQRDQILARIKAQEKISVQHDREIASLKETQWLQDQRIQQLEKENEQNRRRAEKAEKENIEIKQRLEKIERLINSK